MRTSYLRTLKDKGNQQNPFYLFIFHSINSLYCHNWGVLEVVIPFSIHPWYHSHPHFSKKLLNILVPNKNFPPSFIVCLFVACLKVNQHLHQYHVIFFQKKNPKQVLFELLSNVMDIPILRLNKAQLKIKPILFFGNWDCNLNNHFSSLFNYY